MNAAALPITAQLHSWLNAWRWAMDRRARQQPKPYRETPAGQLTGLPLPVSRRLSQFRSHYGVAFEQQLNADNALENYVYLDVLHRLRQQSPCWPAVQGRVLDVGCKNFYYAAALAAAFKPAQLTGLELEGHRRYRDGHRRSDYAAFYTGQLGSARYCVGDVCDWREQADLVSCWYPFVFAEVALAWGLPLSAFAPQRFFPALVGAMAPGGLLLVVNQGLAEWQQTAHWLGAQRLHCVARVAVAAPLLPRPAPPVASLWQA